MAICRKQRPNLTAEVRETIPQAVWGDVVQVLESRSQSEDLLPRDNGFASQGVCIMLYLSHDIFGM